MAKRWRLNIDRQTASRLGITPTIIDNTLYDAFGQRQISTLFTQLNQYHVVLEVPPAFRINPIDLQNIYLKSTSGAPVPMSAFTSIQTHVNSDSGKPHWTISGYHGVI